MHAIQQKAIVTFSCSLPMQQRSDRSSSLGHTLKDCAFLDFLFLLFLCIHPSATLCSLHLSLSLDAGLCKGRGVGTTERRSTQGQGL